MKPVHIPSGAVGYTLRSESPSDLPLEGTLGKLCLPSQFLLLQKKANRPDLRTILSDNVRGYCCCLPVSLLGTGAQCPATLRAEVRNRCWAVRGWSEGYSRIAEEQEVQEGVGPEEVDEGAAQTPACCRENGEAGEEQHDGAKEGDLPPLRSLGQGEIGRDGALDGGHGGCAQIPPSMARDPARGNVGQQAGQNLAR